MFSICIFCLCVLEMTDPCMAQDNSAPPLSSQSESKRDRETDRTERESGKETVDCHSVAIVLALSLWLMQSSMSNTAILSYPGGIVSTTAGIPAENFHFKVSG